MRILSLISSDLVDPPTSYYYFPFPLFQYTISLSLANLGTYKFSPLLSALQIYETRQRSWNRCGRRRRRRRWTSGKWSLGFISNLDMGPFKAHLKSNKAKSSICFVQNLKFQTKEGLIIKVSIACHLTLHLLLTSNQ